MRAPALLVLLLAGCASPGPAGPDAEAPGAGPPATPPDAVDGDPAPVQLDVSGTLWLTPPSGPRPSESVVPFQLNATADVRVTLRLASTLTPVNTADGDVHLRDANGTVLAHATFAILGSPHQSLRAAALAPGAYGLHVALWGGSDGSSSGDYLEYRIEA